MALASALLKHYAVARLARTPWSVTTAAENMRRDARGKPVYVDPATGREPVAFNVSHQDGVVVLVAVAGGLPGVQVGVDIVSTSERRTRDLAMLAKEPGGWADFVDMHADVLAPGEARRLTGIGGAADDKLRAFYSLWALREAYVKLTGEALLAEWLRELEFRDYGPPRPTAAWAIRAEEGDGEVVRPRDIWFKGARVEDVEMCLGSVGQSFMIATAVRAPGMGEDGLAGRLGLYEELTLEEMLEFARTSG